MDNTYDVGIIGAGIAGSSLAILLAKSGYRTAIFEKDIYPKHRVCGEYISMESWGFLKHLGLDLDQINPPKIDQLLLTSQKGSSMKSSMFPGGFGLSRYFLDNALSDLMLKNGVDVFMNTKVYDAQNNKIKIDKGEISCKLIVGAFGKYPPIFSPRELNRKAKNYVGVKYHVKLKPNFSLPANQIALHSFAGGYCGVSKIENETYCLCYLADSTLLKNSNNQIQQLEQKELFRNKHLQQIFENTDSEYRNPQVISNIQFNLNQIQNVKNGIIPIGDAAGSVSPLSGNGMSMAARSAVLLFNAIESHGLQFDSISNIYTNSWKDSFGNRIQFANLLNSIMLSPRANDVVLNVLNHIPLIKHNVIASMHGDSILKLLKKK